MHAPFFGNGGVKMLKTILLVVYVIGAGGGFDNSYWGKNKGSSKQEILKKITAVLTVLFFVLALLLDSKLFN